MIIQEIVDRRSVRSYLPRPVEADKLERIMEAGRLAPTANNKQDWKILVVEEETTRRVLVDMASPHQAFLKEAPVILVACALNPGYVMRCGHPSFLIDLSIVLDHISLQAVREGLGTCWIGSFYQDKAREVLGIPTEVQILELMSLGYPDSVLPARPRKSIAQLYQKNRWAD